MGVAVLRCKGKKGDENKRPKVRRHYGGAAKKNVYVEHKLHHQAFLLASSLIIIPAQTDIKITSRFRVIFIVKNFVG